MSDIHPKVLIICPSMWPRMRSWGETQRMFYLANYLSENGWDVSTLSPDYGSGEDSSDRNMYYSPHFPGKGIRIEQNTQQNKHTEKFSVFASFLRTLASHTVTPFVKWAYNEPDCYEGILKQIWIWKSRQEIRRVLDEAEYETVIISAPSFVLFTFAKFIKKRKVSVSVVFDYRDPWHLWNRKKNFAYCTEKRCLKYADIIVGFTNIFMDDMKKIFHLPAGKCRTVYNGYSETDWILSETDYSPPFIRMPGRLYLIFTGNLTFWESEQNFRNPFPLIEAVSAFPDVELYFIGVRGQIPDINYQNIHFIRNVSQKESFHFMKAADVLLSIHDTADSSGNYLISGKFYDYIRSGKVIWHIGRQEDLMSEWIRQYHLGVFCTNHPLHIKEMLQFLLQKQRENRLDTLRKNNEVFVQQFSREMQNSHYADILHSIQK